MRIKCVHTCKAFRIEPAYNKHYISICELYRSVCEVNKLHRMSLKKRSMISKPRQQTKGHMSHSFLFVLLTLTELRQMLLYGSVAYWDPPQPPCL